MKNSIFNYIKATVVVITIILAGYYILQNIGFSWVPSWDKIVSFIIVLVIDAAVIGVLAFVPYFGKQIESNYVIGMIFCGTSSAGIITMFKFWGERAIRRGLMLSDETIQFVDAWGMAEKIVIWSILITVFVFSLINATYGILSVISIANTGLVIKEIYLDDFPYAILFLLIVVLAAWVVKNVIFGNQINQWRLALINRKKQKAES